MLLMGQILKGSWDYRNGILTTTAEGKSESDLFTVERDGEEVIKLINKSDGDQFVLTLRKGK
ncbi:hypothetical protein ACFLRI_01785, partial [Bacteroidota bacterium]